ncbi:Insulin like peptide 3 [Frankliniella occidentalis]|uniref:Insulin-like growth factor I n=1 Tax=Frankliniella occidentalis TaxID=133901 RepID=A0A6J1SJK3_FRAOC|nr:insulin-like growth factor I [Frankliniella occidentalis]XP_026279595.1 insulin-like growth factor I [Frankliniella occidentalis]KAE8743919.1 Insulin like peptide 3 [Frankliniella occidentalis]
MTPSLLRVVLGALLALALLDGALSRPHAPRSGEQQQQHDQHGLGNELSARHPHRQHHRHHPHPHHARQLCGAELSNALSALCAGRGYNSPDNMAGSSASRHGHRGLVAECCHVGCTLSDLEHYCQPRKTPLVASQSTSESHEATAEEESDPRPETGNHIRPAVVEAEAEPPQRKEQKAPPQPTVVGAKGSSKINLPSENPSNMIQVGVLTSPLQQLQFRTPVTIPSRPQSNSLGSH